MSSFLERLLRQSFVPVDLVPAFVSGVRILLMIVAAILAIRIMDRTLRRLRLLVPRVDTGSSRVVQRAETLRHIIRSFLKVLILVLLVAGVTTEVGINLAPLLAGVGIVSLAVGFGAQSLVKDVIAGFFIIFEDQFAVGDTVRIGDLSGNVEHMSIRVTVLRNVEGEVHVIPNGSIQTVTVMTKDWGAAQVDVFVPYAEDIDRVSQTLQTVIDGIHRDYPDQVIEPPKVLGVERLGDEFVTLRVIAKTLPHDRWDIRREMRRRIQKELQLQGVQLPELRRGVVVVSEGGEAGPVSGPAPGST